MDKRALLKYLCALLLFGLNGIVASNIALNSCEIVFLRTMIGSILLIALFLLGRNKFHIKGHGLEALLITPPASRWAPAGCSSTRRTSRSA